MTQPNLPPDVNKGPMELAIDLALLVLTLLQIALRLHTRIYVSRAVGWDDWFAVASVVLATVQIGLTIQSVRNGYGRHIEYLTEHQILTALKFTFFAEPINIIAVGLQKISIAIALLRLNLSTAYKTIVWIAIVPNTFIMLMTQVVIFARCRPIDLNWNITAPGTCWSAEWNVATGYAQASSNILVDIAFVVSPIVFLAKVQLTKYNQWALRIIFLVGLFATICSIVKITTLPILFNTTDPTWVGVPLSLWSTAELLVGLIVASAPALKPRYESFVRKFLDVTSISNGRSRRTGYATPGKYGTGNSKYGPGRSIQHGDFDDTEDLKLDYYHKTLGAQSTTTRTDVGHDSSIGNKTVPSENSSEDIIFQGLNAGDETKNDRIRVTHTVEINNQHAL